MSDYSRTTTDADFGPLFASSVVNNHCAIDVEDHSDDDANAENKRRLVLKRLSEGPLSTFEAERLVYEGTALHRVQATIGSLRSLGHVIHTKRINGVRSYVYERFEPKTKTTPAIKEYYYKTPHWIALSRERKQFDGFACVQCKTSIELETHHLRYNLFEESVIEDLLTLCRTHHEAMHEAASGSGMHFPDSITEDVFQRLRQCFPKVFS